MELHQEGPDPGKPVRFSKSLEDVVHEITGKFALRRMTEDGEVAEAAIFFCSDRAKARSGRCSCCWAKAEATATPNPWPEIDIVADSFLLHGRDLGKLELTAQPRGPDWQIHPLPGHSQVAAAIQAGPRTVACSARA